MIGRMPGGMTPRRMGAVAFLASALVAAFLIWKLEAHRLEEERARTTSLASDYAQALQRNLERTLSATYALAAMVRQGNGEFPAFEEVARQMLHYFPGADSLQLAPGGVTRHIVPLAGNEAGLGRDLLRDPRRNKEALLARDSKKLTLAGPFELIQGGTGVIGRFPVFLDDAGNGERFWGFATVVIRFPGILEQIGLPQLSRRGFAYQLWRIRPDTGERQIIAASTSALPADPVDRPVSVPNGTWTLSLAPLAGWGDPLGLALKTALGLLFSLLLAWLARLLVASKLHEAELATLLAKRTAEIRESEQRLRQVEDNLPESYVYQYVHDAGGAPRFLYVSAGVERVHGVTVEDVLRDAGALHRQIDPAQWPALVAAETASLREMRDFAMELRMLRADGKWRWLQLRSHPRRNPDGRVVWDGVATDVTEHIEAVVALRENEERLRLFIEHAPAALAMFDRNMHYLQASRRWRTDYGLGEQTLTGLSHYEVFPEIPDEWREVHRRGLAGEVVRADADLFARADGSEQWLRWEVRPWFDAGGAVGGIVIFTEDITAQKQAEEKIYQLNAELERRVEQRTRELESKNLELERLNRLFVGRELKMRELKARIAALEHDRGAGNGHD